MFITLPFASRCEIKLNVLFVIVMKREKIVLHPEGSVPPGSILETCLATKVQHKLCATIIATNVAIAAILSAGLLP